MIGHTYRPYEEDPRPRIPSVLVMASLAMGAQVGVFRFFFSDHTRKNKHKTDVSMIFAHRVAFYVWLSSCSDHCRFR